MNFICPVDSKEFKSLSGLVKYLEKNYPEYCQVFYRWYYYERLGLEIPRCPICGKIIKMKSPTVPRKTCGDKQCAKALTQQKNKIIFNTLENKERARKNRFNFLNNPKNFQKTSWGYRKAGKLSYLEEWFVNNIIIKFNLVNKYDIVNEYGFHGYFLDFAFLNIKLDVEIDGKCHFTSDERIRHDRDREKNIIEKGWKIYRISYLDIMQSPEKCIIDFLSFLENIDTQEFSIKKYSQEILKNDELKKLQLEKKIQKKKILEELKNQKFLEAIKFIDLNTFGALKKIKDSTGYSYNYIKKLLRNNHLDFFGSSKESKSSNQCWVFNDFETKRIFVKDLKNYIKAGYLKGRKHNYK